MNRGGVIDAALVGRWTFRRRAEAPISREPRNGLGVLLHHGDHSLQINRMPEVVGVEQEYEVRIRCFDPVISGRTDSAIGTHDDLRDHRVLFRQSRGSVN